MPATICTEHEHDLSVALAPMVGARATDGTARSTPPLLKVIVAEDSELQRLFLCSLINGLGFEAIEAEDGRVALDLIQQTGAQILISDLEMPHLDGVGLTRKIRQLGLDHYVHVIMVTGADETEIRDEALLAGVDDFITKGSSTAMLKARLRTATRLVSHRAAAEAQRQLLPNLRKDILGFGVASAFVPSSIVSGDMFGCFELENGNLGFYAIDVSGHGVLVRRRMTTTSPCSVASSIRPPANLITVRRAIRPRFASPKQAPRTPSETVASPSG